jgi:hypothetical protein
VNIGRVGTHGRYIGRGSVWRKKESSETMFFSMHKLEGGFCIIS